MNKGGGGHYTLHLLLLPTQSIEIILKILDRKKLCPCDNCFDYLHLKWQ